MYWTPRLGLDKISPTRFPTVILRTCTPVRKWPVTPVNLVFHYMAGITHRSARREISGFSCVQRNRTSDSSWYTHILRGRLTYRNGQQNTRPVGYSVSMYWTPRLGLDKISPTRWPAVPLRTSAPAGKCPITPVNLVFNHMARITHRSACRKTSKVSYIQRCRSGYIRRWTHILRGWRRLRIHIRTHKNQQQEKNYRQENNSLHLLTPFINKRHILNK